MRGKKGISRSTPIVIFVFFFSVYVLSSSGHFDPWDGITFFLNTQYIVQTHSIELKPDPETLEMLSSHVKPEFSPGVISLLETRALLTPIIAIPFYYVATALSVSPVSFVALFTNSFIMSLTCVLVFCFSLHLYRSPKISLALTFIFGVCSFVWDYNNSLLSQPTQMLFIFASAFFIYLSKAKNQNIEKTTNELKKESMTSGSSVVVVSNTSLRQRRRIIFYSILGAVFLGLSLIAHQTSAIFIPGFLLYFIIVIRARKNRKSLILIFIGVLAAILFIFGLTNVVRYGSFTNIGYGETFYGQTLSTYSSWHGLVGLLVSPGRGLIFYFPVAILLPVAFRYLYPKNRGLFFICLYVFLALWLFNGPRVIPTSPLAESENWSGGWWGSRYLVPALPFLTLPLGTLFELNKGKKRTLLFVGLIVLSISGFLINLSGVLVWYWFPITVGNEGLGTDPFGSGHSYDVKTWDPTNSWITLTIQILMSGYVSHVPAEQFPNNFSLAPCIYDNFIYCNYGIWYVFLGITIIVAVGTIMYVKVAMNNKNKVMLDS